MDDKKLDEELKNETGELVSEELKTEKLISEELKTEEIGSSVNIEEGLTQAVEMGEDATQVGNGETGENDTQTGNGEPVEDGTQTENGETGEGVNKTEEAGDEENKTDKMQSEAESSGTDVMKADAKTSRITLDASWEDEACKSDNTCINASNTYEWPYCVSSNVDYAKKCIWTYITNEFSSNKDLGRKLSDFNTSDFVEHYCKSLL